MTSLWPWLAAGSLALAFVAVGIHMAAMLTMIGVIATWLTRQLGQAQRVQ